jgi:two-component system response regulator QseB
MRVLLVEDDESLGEGLCSGLTEYDHIIDWIRDGELAKRAIDSEFFDIIILDLGLPKLSGMQLLRHLRNVETPNYGTPVLILTANDEIQDRVQGLDTGADDYLTKPCDLEELEARIRALHRRRAGIMTSVLVRDNISINTIAHEITLDGEPVFIPRREFAILQKLLENQGRVISRETIVQILYGWGEEVDSNVVEVHIHNLRKKFGNKLIRTIRGLGYMIAKLHEKEILEEREFIEADLIAPELVITKSAPTVDLAYSEIVKEK